ncbi:MULTISPECIES: hypothetical protein [unclassified Gilliamella]|uniref:hypothetical protein n=1 Tax=unclassified Gilliamella TaxID=2685620 RepID=UPI001F450820|nr:hypothetical protein [Gilliamella sp. Pra-s65]
MGRTQTIAGNPLRQTAKCLSLHRPEELRTAGAHRHRQQPRTTYPLLPHRPERLSGRTDQRKR